MHPDPESFVREWLHGWNCHDLDAILAHYCEDMEMSSPYIAQMAGETSGRLRACYELTLVASHGKALGNMSRTKTRKCKPASTCGSRS